MKKLYRIYYKNLEGKRGQTEVRGQEELKYWISTIIQEKGKIEEIYEIGHQIDL